MTFRPLHRDPAHPVPDDWRDRAAPIVAVAGLMAGMVAGLVVLAHERGRAADRPLRGEAAPRRGQGEGGGRADASDHAALARARAAESANEAKTRYLVSVSHEIRSPLNAIYGYAQLLERGAIPAPEAGAVIRRSAEHLTNLVEGLLEMSRIESGTVTIRSDMIDVRALLEQVMEMFRVQAAAKGLSLDLKVNGHLPARARTDEKRLRQILINLVSNAIKYTRTGGAAVIVSYRSEVMDLEVRDTGIGIARDEIDRIFAPFERGGSPDVQRQPGVGLGLAITRMLAHILGGDVAVTSTPGVGSSFRLRLMLPTVARPPGAAEQIRRVEGYTGAQRTVLVIDDDPAQAAVVRGLLNPLGFAVHAAASGEDGIALAVQCRPDIALLDIQMPGMSGWQVAERLRAAHGDALRIVMVSANAHEFRAGGGGGNSDGGHDAFVTKPFSLDALLDVVGRQLGLLWQGEAVAANDAQGAPAPEPADATAGLDRIRHLAEIGHVSGIEQALREVEASGPGAAGLAATLRTHLDAFELRSLVQVLDDAGAS